MATYVSGEIYDPQRSLGRALALGTALCVALALFCQEYAILGLVSSPGSLPGAVAWLLYSFAPSRHSAEHGG